MREQKHDITDQGWAAMQRILDREMPRRRRRRVAGWWWFGGLLLLPVLGIAGWQLYQHTNQNLPQPAVPMLPAAPLAEHTPTSVLPDNANAGVYSSKAEVGRSTTMFAKPQKFNKHIATTSGISEPSRVEAQSFLTKKEGFVNDEMSNVATLNAATSPAVPAENPLIAEEANTASAYAVLSTLPALSPAIETESNRPDFPTYPAYASPEITKKAAYRPTWALGLVAGVTSERLPRVNGATLGAVADWQPLRRWGLRSGIQYAVQNLADDESLVTTIPEDSYEKASTGVALFDQDGNYGNLDAFSSINTNILASVRRIHRFEAPLLVYWQPMHKLRAYAGASMNYTFLAQTSPRIFSENQVFKVVSGRDELNKLATEKLNRWQVKWQFGVGYRITRWAEINAGIQAALPKISLRKGGSLNDETYQTANANRSNISAEEVSQMAVHLRGVVYF